MNYESVSLGATTRKTLLYRTGVEYGDYCVNHVEGCSHGCTYPCYAMMMKKRTGVVSGYDEWTRPKIVTNALELLKKELPRHKNKIRSVYLCFATDPFMVGYDEIHTMSLQIIERLNRSDIYCTVLTKGVYPVQQINMSHRKNRYGITLVSLSETFRKTYEPQTAMLSERIGALDRLHKAGFPTWVSIEPYPTPNIISQDIRKLLAEVSFATEIVFGKLNYNAKVKAYPRWREFYNEQAAIVAEYCTKRGIRYHIKNGTISEPYPVEGRQEEDGKVEFNNLPR